MTDVTNALKNVALVSVNKTRAAAADTKVFEFFKDPRVVAFLMIVFMWIKYEENKKEEKDRNTVSIAGVAFFLLGLAYVIFISYSLISEFIVYFFEALGSENLIDTVSQRVIDVNLYNMLIGLRKSLHSAAGLHENLTPDDLKGI